jgi:hypothetical protein
VIPLSGFVVLRLGWWDTMNVSKETAIVSGFRASLFAQCVGIDISPCCVLCALCGRL